jgi:hypothetical protein
MWFRPIVGDGEGKRQVDANAGQPAFFSAVAALFFFLFPLGRVLPVVP